MKEKFDWDKPMTRKNWAVIYGVSFIMIVLYCIWWTFTLFNGEIKVWVKKIFK